MLIASLELLAQMILTTTTVVMRLDSNHFANHESLLEIIIEVLNYLQQLNSENICGYYYTAKITPLSNFVKLMSFNLL